jgi:hypothetical protein
VPDFGIDVSPYRRRYLERGDDFVPDRCVRLAGVDAAVDVDSECVARANATASLPSRTSCCTVPLRTAYGSTMRPSAGQGYDHITSAIVVTDTHLRPLATSSH